MNHYDEWFPYCKILRCWALSGRQRYFNLDTCDYVLIQFFIPAFDFKRHLNTNRKVADCGIKSKAICKAKSLNEIRTAVGEDSLISQVALLKLPDVPGDFGFVKKLESLNPVGEDKHNETQEHQDWTHSTTLGLELCVAVHEQRRRRTKLV